MSKDSKSTYYDAGGIETLDIIRAKLTPEQYQGYLLGNIIKYGCRANWKGNAQRDVEKVEIYARLLFDVMGGRGGSGSHHTNNLTTPVSDLPIPP